MLNWCAVLVLAAGVVTLEQYRERQLAQLLCKDGAQIHDLSIYEISLLCVCVSVRVPAYV